VNEKTLIILCLIVSLIGILIMFTTNKFLGKNIIKISEVTENLNSVSVEGSIINLDVTESGTVFIRLEDDSGIINVVVFKNSIKEVESLNIGNKIVVQGKPDIYKGSLELIATKIIKNPS